MLSNANWPNQATEVAYQHLTADEGVRLLYRDCFSAKRVKMLVESLTDNKESKDSLFADLSLGSMNPDVVFAALNIIDYKLLYERANEGVK